MSDNRGFGIVKIQVVMNDKNVASILGLKLSICFGTKTLASILGLKYLASVLGQKT